MKTKSFTLIELLVVIVIIGILAGVIIVSTSSSISKANFAKAQAFSNTVQQELLLNLVSEWTFDEGNAQDSWGNNDGVVTGATYQNKASGNCVYGGCYLFDNDDNIDCGNKTDYNFANINHSLSFWVNANEDSSHTQYLLNRRVPGTPGSGYTIYIYTNNYIHYEERAAVAVPSLRSDFSKLYNSWHFVFATTDIAFKERKFYIDGKKVDENTYTGDFIESNISLYLGGTSYSGLLDDVRIYNGTISSSQIKQEYIAGLNSLLVNGSISNEEYNGRLSNIANY